MESDLVPTFGHRRLLDLRPEYLDGGWITAQLVKLLMRGDDCTESSHEIDLPLGELRDEFPMTSSWASLGQAY
ncbi:hypothetical protein [Kitasatospora sp. NPDC004531]